MWKRTAGGAKRAQAGRKATLLGSAAVFALTPSLSIAQQSDAPQDAIVLDMVTVEAQAGGGAYDGAGLVADQTSIGSGMPTDILETPASVSVITSEEIERRNADSVEEALDYTAGVTTNFYGSDDRFDFLRIRGFDANTYRDGLPLGAPFGSPREEIYAYDRVEVLRGANSTVFGVSDPGGAVNYVTKLPRREAFGEAYVTGGSFDHAEVGFDVGGNVTNSDTLSYRLTGKFQDAEKEYDYSRDDEKFIMGGLTWRPTEATNLSVVYDHLYRSGVPGSGGHPIGTDFPRSRFFGEPDYNYRGLERNTVSILFDHDFGNGLSVSSNARYSKSESDFGYAYIAATPTDGSTIAQRSFFANDSSDEIFVMDAHGLYEADLGFVDSRTLFGFDYRDAKADNTGYFGAAPSIDWLRPIYTGAPASVPVFNSSATDQTSKALYLQQELTFAERLIATVGVRNDWIDTEQRNQLTDVVEAGDISELTSRVGLTYLLTDEFSVFGSYAESAVPASIGIEPERGVQYELGAKYRPDAFPALVTASVYELTKDNITRTDPITLQQTPIGEIRVRGVDVEAKAQLPYNFDLIAAYSYLDAEIVENGTAGNEGNRPAFVPEHIASVWVDYTIPGQGWRGDMTFGVGGRFESSYFFDDRNTLSVDDHIVFDAAFNYDVAENTTFQVNAKNIFDEKYVSYGGFGADFYNPGREVSVTLRHSW